MKLIRFILFTFLFAFAHSAIAQDILVKKDGSILNVYNLEESSNSYFYTLEPSSDATVQKIGKDDVFSIKKQNGETLQPSKSDQIVAKKRQIPTHDPVTAQISSEIQTNKKGGRWFSARTPDGHELNYLILSDNDHTLAVTRGKYRETDYVIPEYVQVGDVKYVVTEIDRKAFDSEKTIKSIQFPTTLKKIGEIAFFFCVNLEKILLPEGIEEIGNRAFTCAGVRSGVSEIYVPSSIKKMGDAFWDCSKDTSFNGWCQAYFSNLPDFITEGNCKSYGIDEEAVRAYNLKRK